MLSSKGLKGLILSFVLLISLFTVTAFADSPISVYLDGELLQFDVAPRTINDRTMVPMRKIFEELGASVEWDGDTQKITAIKDDTTIVMQIGNDLYFCGLEQKHMDSPPVEIDGRTLVPVRTISESLGCAVDWVEETQTVIITTPGFSGELPSFSANSVLMNDTYIGNDYRFAEDNVQYIDKYIVGGGSWVIHPEPLSDESAKAYAEVVNSVADALPGVNVYNILVPTSDEFYAPLSQYQNQVGAFKTVCQNLNDNVTAVNAIKNLYQHASEYIFYRTDHHWTQLGSYYAYQAFKAAKGEAADPIDTFETEVLEGFTGSYASSLEGKITVEPDFVQSYFPKVDTAGAVYFDQTMQEVKYQNVSPVHKGRNTYGNYIGGDNPLVVFTTSAGTGKKLVIIKDSYGNAFSTWTVNDYSEVYVIDPRYFNGNNDNNYPMSLTSLYNQIGGFDDLVIISYPPMMQWASTRKLITDMI